MKKQTWLRQKIYSSGKNDVELAASIGVIESTLRTWTRRNQIPEDDLPKFAGLLGISVEEMKKNVTTCRRRRRVPPDKVNYDILPLIKAVASSDAKSVTMAQLVNVMHFTRNLRGEVTPVLVSELLKAM